MALLNEPAPESTEEQPFQPGHPAGSSTLSDAFVYAFAGVRYVWRTQRNFKIHVVAGATALSLAALLRVAPTYVAALVLTIGLVLVLEVLNTALEAIVDLISPRYHPLAKVAKDAAAGAVLIAALTAVAVGIVAFGSVFFRMI